MGDYSSEAAIHRVLAARMPNCSQAEVYCGEPVIGASCEDAGGGYGKIVEIAVLDDVSRTDC